MLTFFMTASSLQLQFVYVQARKVSSLIQMEI